MRRGGQSYFHLQDMLANVTSLTDSAGAVVEDYEYSAFGKQATPDSALGNPFTFAGSQWDTESSTYYNRARQLDPASGRFTSEDPIRSANAYIYAGNDPVSSRDPSGLFSTSELNSANVIRNELMQEQIGFGLDLVGAIGGSGPSATGFATNMAGAGAVGAIPNLARGFRFARRTIATTPRGTSFDIPPGWLPRLADNGKGIVYQRPGATGNADMIRIMEPTDKYPDGYFRYYNRDGQPLDVNGKPGPPEDTHIPENYVGPLPAWPMA